MTGPGVSSGASGQPWKGYDPTAAGRHWGVPRAALKALEKEGVDIPPGLHDRLDLLHHHGFVYIPRKPGGVPRFKRHIDGASAVYGPRHNFRHSSDQLTSKRAHGLRNSEATCLA